VVSAVIANFATHALQGQAPGIGIVGDHFDPGFVQLL
jgi:hypothetical protein